jgi:hypothetical protein
MRKRHLIRCFMSGIIYSMISIMPEKLLSHSILKIVSKTRLFWRLKNKLKIIQTYKGKNYALFIIIDLTIKNSQMFMPKNFVITIRIT